MRMSEPTERDALRSSANCPHTRKLHPGGGVGVVGSAPLRRIESQRVQTSSSTQFIKISEDIAPASRTYMVGGRGSGSYFAQGGRDRVIAFFYASKMQLTLR